MHNSKWELHPYVSRHWKLLAQTRRRLLPGYNAMVHVRFPISYLYSLRTSRLSFLTAQVPMRYVASASLGISSHFPHFI